MIFFLYGPDTYRSRQKLKEMIDHYKEIRKSGLNLKYFDAENLSYEDFQDEFQQISMFEEKKLIVLTNIFSNQDFKDKFLKNSKKLISSDDIILVFEEGKPKKDKLFEFLKQKTESQAFELLEGEKLKNWIKKEFLKFKIKTEPETENLLIDSVGSDLWRLSNEIRKLVNFKKSNTALGEKIGPSDVKLLIKPTIETDIFETIDAISLQNKKKAISLIHQHLEKGDAPLYLLSMINFQFRNLLMVKDLMEKNHPYYAILKITKLHPFVVKKSYQQAYRFSLPELKKIYQKIFQVDLEIKTGKIEPETALDLLIAGI